MVVGDTNRILRVSAAAHTLEVVMFVLEILLKVIGLGCLDFFCGDLAPK